MARRAVLELSDRAAYITSLERLADLDFDHLVPWAASLDGPALVPTGRADAAERIGRIIDRLRSGATTSPHLSRRPPNGAAASPTIRGKRGESGETGEPTVRQAPAKAGRGAPVPCSRL